MEYELKTHEIPYEEIDNGGLILLLLRHCNTFETLCERYEYANASQLRVNTNARQLRDKLFKMRKVGLISFAEEMTDGGERPVGEIKINALWSDIITALGGMHRIDFALLSRHSTGLATVPVFGRPRQPHQHVDIFVLMPFGDKSKNLYFDHIKQIGEELEHWYRPGSLLTQVRQHRLHQEDALDGNACVGRAAQVRSRVQERAVVDDRAV